jgi:ubiquinone/menaquinone biosynthesis C-methylase UbiE
MYSRKASGQVGPSTLKTTTGDWWEHSRALLVKEQAKEEEGLLIDVGCGEAHALSDTVGIDGKFLVGVDAWLSPSWELGPERAFVVADVTQLPFRSGVASVVTSLDVFEHLQDETDCLKEISRIAAPDALTIVMVPALEILWSEHDDEVGHVRRYRRKDVSSLLTQNGMKVVKSTYFFMWLVPLAVIRRFAGRYVNAKQSGGKSMGTIATKLSRFEAWLVSKGVRLPMGTSVLVSARTGKASEND